MAVRDGHVAAIHVTTTGSYDYELENQAEHDRDGVSGTEVLVVFCEAEDKEALLQAHPEALFTTPHYDGYAALLVRLADVDRGLLAELLVDSYRLRAPKSLARTVASDFYD
jgi:hypothetical protein